MTNARTASIAYTLIDHVIRGGRWAESIINNKRGIYRSDLILALNSDLSLRLSEAEVSDFIDCVHHGIAINKPRGRGIEPAVIAKKIGD